MIAGIDHINIATDKLEETRRFFVEILGLEAGFRPDFKFPGYWLYAGARDIVHLVGLKAPPEPNRRAALDHFAFQIADYEAMRERLEERGVPYRELTALDGSRTQIVLRDPNGVTIELRFRAM